MAAGTKVLITDTLAGKLQGKVDLSGAVILPHGNQPRDLLAMDQRELDALRAKVLGPLEIRFEAPPRVALYPFGKDFVAVENFNDAAAPVRLTLVGWRKAHVALTLGQKESPGLRMEGGAMSLDVPGRALVLLRRDNP